jgi:uncharacterized repeat protein (TIGR03803 family)
MRDPSVGRRDFTSNWSPNGLMYADKLPYTNLKIERRSKIMSRLLAPWERSLAIALVAGSVAVASPMARSQTFNVVHRFNWNNGANPLAGLTVDGSDLYGTTSAGGKFGVGTVFEIKSSGEENVLYDFTGGEDGASPEAALILIGGNLYGTTAAGGASDAGTVFEVTPRGTEKVLFSFNGKADGANPEASLIADADGNLYGTTNMGGKYGAGTVFKLVRPKVEDEAWTEEVLHSFGKGDDGADPVAGVSFDKTGNLYGTTSAGGAYQNGTVFQLEASKTGWTEKTLHNFELEGDGGVPYAGIVVNGDKLYGAATDGGDGGSDGGGTVFELTPVDGGWKFTVLYQLPGWGISGSYRNLLLASGKIYATTHCDGANDAGTVYELTPSGDTWKERSLYTFTGGSDGLFSFSNLVLYNGSLYGTTKQGGDNSNGVVFKVTLP